MALDDRLDLYEVKAQFERFTEWLDLGEIVADLGFLRRARRTLLPLPLVDRPVPIDPSAHLQPFRPRPVPELQGKRIALVASGGGGAAVALHELATDRFGDVMLHHKLVEAEIAEAIGRLGRRLFAWTVDEPAPFSRIADLRVSGSTHHGGGISSRQAIRGVHLKVRVARANPVIPQMATIRR